MNHNQRKKKNVCSIIWILNHNNNNTTMLMINIMHDNDMKIVVCCVVVAVSHDHWWFGRLFIKFIAFSLGVWLRFCPMPVASTTNRTTSQSKHFSLSSKIVMHAWNMLCHELHFVTKIMRWICDITLNAVQNTLIDRRQRPCHVRIAYTADSTSGYTSSVHACNKA